MLPACPSPSPRHSTLPIYLVSPATSHQPPATEPQSYRLRIHRHYASISHHYFLPPFCFAQDWKERKKTELVLHGISREEKHRPGNQSIKQASRTGHQLRYSFLAGTFVLPGYAKLFRSSVSSIPTQPSVPCQLDRPAQLLMLCMYVCFVYRANWTAEQQQQQQRASCVDVEGDGQTDRWTGCNSEAQEDNRRAGADDLIKRKRKNRQNRETNETRRDTTKRDAETKG
ncbi:hypothetical protein IWX92DRAFT_240083 [Phyllosticta citricarpa]